MRRLYAFLLVIPLLGAAHDLWACTSFIISGKVTPDGKPILYKNRDTDSLKNSLAIFTDGKFRCVGVVNSDKTWRTMVWGGYNEMGFAIINTAAYNNNLGDRTKLQDMEGVLMKLALQNCRTLKDFENLLDTLRKPMGVDANFGVIDALGGAAYYETGNFRYIKFDVNDPQVAPNGILIRTNYSESYDRATGYGFCRFGTAQNVIDEVVATKNYSPRYLLNSLSRSMKHSLTKTDLMLNLPAGAVTPDYRFFTDYITRHSTASAMMIVGANGISTASSVVMWTVLGFPLTAAAVPVWLLPNVDLPKVVAMDSKLQSPICAAALKLKESCFPLKYGNWRNYINLSVVVNAQGSGYLQQMQSIEDEVFKKADAILRSPGNATKLANDVREYYIWLDSYLSSQYHSYFGIKLLE